MIRIKPLMLSDLGFSPGVVIPVKHMRVSNLRSAAVCVMSHCYTSLERHTKPKESQSSLDNVCLGLKLFE